MEAHERARFHLADVVRAVADIVVAVGVAGARSVQPGDAPISRIRRLRERRSRRGRVESASRRAIETVLPRSGLLASATDRRFFGRFSLASSVWTFLSSSLSSFSSSASSSSSTSSSTSSSSSCSASFDSSAAFSRRSLFPPVAARLDNVPDERHGVYSFHSRIGIDFDRNAAPNVARTPVTVRRNVVGRPIRSIERVRGGARRRRRVRGRVRRQVRRRVRRRVRRLVRRRVGRRVRRR